MAEGKILYANHDGIHVLRLVGEIRCALAPSFERFLGQLLANSASPDYVVDLTETVLVDSTHLGLLARLAGRVAPRRVTLISDREDINTVLRSMGFDAIFDIVSENRAQGERGSEVPYVAADREAVNATLLNAHRALMALNAQNRTTFRDVVVALEREQQRSRPEGPDTAKSSPL